VKLYRKYRRTKRTVKISVVLLTLGFALLLSGCGAKQQEQFHDADRGTENSAPADTIAMPDGYGNLATKCDHGNRVYVLFHNDAPYGAVAVVPNDLTCPKEK
jgi:hypothetical protein